MDHLGIVTWNVNGLRSFPDDSLQSKWISEFPSHIFCIQETKITREMLDEQTAIWPDTSSYFAFSRKRSGYSGVATFCTTKATPEKAEEGLTSTLPSSKYEDSLSECKLLDDVDLTPEEIKDLDSEGRAVITQHAVQVIHSGEYKRLILFNLYCPRHDPEKPGREKYKLNFYSVLEHRAREWDSKGYLVLICGDINTSHKEIDHCDPYEEFGSNPSRQWMDSFLGVDTQVDRPTFYDAFRLLHPNKEHAFTCWNTKINARSNNYGTRIDYFFVNHALKDFVSECQILSQVEGSDHCPVQILLSGLTPIPSSKPPSFCTKYYPELSGKQTSLTSFFAPSKRMKMEEDLPRPVKRSTSAQQTKLTHFILPKESTCKSSSSEFINPEKQSESASAWRALLNRQSAKLTPPLCKGHNEASVLRTVKKKGPNLGRQFWVCSRGEGREDDPQARCNFFAWAKK